MNRRNYPVSAAILIFPLLLTAAFAAVCGGCRFFYMTPVTVTAWEPKEAVISGSEREDVRVTFSAPMDRLSAERAFALTYRGSPVSGLYRWEGETLIFEVLQPFPRPGEYRMAVADTAEDLYGNNPAEDFSHCFSRGGDTRRPEIIAVEPADGSEAAGELRAITIIFSEGMDRGSVYDSFSIEPSIEGNFIWAEEDSLVRFVPVREFEAKTRYTFVIGSGAADTAGNSLAEDFRSVFTLGRGYPEPEIVSAGTSSGDVVLTAETPGDADIEVNGGWECYAGIRLIFNTPVTLRSAEKGIRIFPETHLLLLPEDAAADTLTVTFPEGLVYDTVYTVTIGTEIESEAGLPLPKEIRYTIRSNGARSRPPSVEKITFFDNPGGGVITEYQAFDLLSLHNFTPHTPGQDTAFFDIYFRAAETAELIPGNFMEAFSCSVTNGCAVFDALAVEYETLSGPAPDPPAGEGEKVTRVHFRIEDKPENGIVELKLDKTFADSLGNEMTEDWIFPLNEATP
jgi:hypothetical protein